MLHLFKTYTSSFYGIDLWFEKLKKFQLHKISVVYHKAIKKILKMNLWDSNHLACENLGVPIFKHLIAKRVLCFWFNLSNSTSPCLVNMKHYFRYRSQLYSKVAELMMEDYSVTIHRNPLCALLSRIKYVQYHEPRSCYVPHLNQ